MRLNFQIGRIALHGYAQADRARFTDSLRASLTELAGARDSLHLASADRLRVDLRPGASVEEAARQVAARILEGRRDV